MIKYDKMESVKADRPLVTIVRIKNIRAIIGADRIEKAEINGWKCIIKKGEFNIGDLAIYYKDV